MDDTAAEKQIDQMVKFIKQEAHEKAREIKTLADEEFQLEKLQTIEQDKSRIRKEYERKENQVEITRKIEYSKQLNEQRLKILGAKQSAIGSLLSDVKGNLVSFTKDQSAYTQLLTQLIAQGMRTLQEDKVLVRCRQVDDSLVEAALQNVASVYKQAYNTEAPSATIDKEQRLDPPYVVGQDDDAPSCLGGVLLTSTDRKIKCSNTLDDRLLIAYE